MRPARTGLPSAARRRAWVWRFLSVVSSGCLFGACREFRQRVVGDRRDRGEIAVRDPFLAGEPGDVVGDRAKRQVDNGARIRRDVRRAGMHQVAMEHHHRARLAGGGDDTAFIHQLRHRLVVQRPERVGGGFQIVAGVERAVLVAFRDEHQRAVDRHYLVEEDGDVHRPRFRHAVVARPGAVILVPLPDRAFEGGLRVHLELVHVDVFAEELADRLDQARMGAEQSKGLVIGMGGEGGARRAGRLAPDLFAVGRVDLPRLVAQRLDLGLGKTVREEQVTLFVELGQLVVCQSHVSSPVAGYGSGPH